MNIQNIIRWAGVVTGALYGLTVTGFGIYLAIQAQDCLSYNDYACAFGGMFSFAIIPFGLVVLLSIGLAALPFKLSQLIGGLFSFLTGVGVFVLFCLFSSYVLYPDSESLIGSDIGTYLSIMLMQLIGALALTTVGGLAVWNFRKKSRVNE